MQSKLIRSLKNLNWKLFLIILAIISIVSGCDKNHRNDKLENSIYEKDATGHEVWFEYYDDGKLKSEKLSDGREIQYDEHGNTTYKIEGGIEHWFEYYDDGKLKFEKLSDGREIQYDEHGNPTYKIEGGIEHWFEYYDDGKLKSEKLSDESEIKYKYNSAGVRYEYDKVGKLLRIRNIGVEEYFNCGGEYAPELSSIQFFGKKPNWKYKYLYDDEGFETGWEGKATMYNSNGKLIAEYSRTTTISFYSELAIPTTEDDIKLYYDNGKIAEKFSGFYWYKAPFISKILYDRKGNISQIYEYAMTHTDNKGFTGADIEYKDGKVFRMVINVLYANNICLVFKHSSSGTDVLCKQCKYGYNSQEMEGDFFLDFPKGKEFKYTFMDFPTINEENCEHIFHYKHNINGILEGLMDYEDKEKTPPHPDFINDYSDGAALDAFIDDIVDYYREGFYE